MATEAAKGQLELAEKSPHVGNEFDDAYAALSNRNAPSGEQHHDWIGRRLDAIKAGFGPDCSAVV
jgi:hypothetical protein